MYVILRLFANCPDEATSWRLQGQVCQSLAEFKPRGTVAPKPDWRDAGRFELSLQVFPGDRDTFDQLVALVPAGWTLYGDDVDASAVWNPAPGCVLLDPAIVWAEVIFSAHGTLGYAM
jgi:hypothetical protein